MSPESELAAVRSIVLMVQVEGSVVLDEHPEDERRLVRWAQLMTAEPGLSPVEQAQVLGVTPRRVRQIRQQVEREGDE